MVDYFVLDYLIFREGDKLCVLRLCHLMFQLPQGIIVTVMEVILADVRPVMFFFRAWWAPPAFRFGSSVSAARVCFFTWLIAQ